MSFPRIIPTFVLMAFAAGSARAEQDLPNTDNITDGIRTFICDVEEAGGSWPIILVKSDGQWSISGDDFLDRVTEIDRGFRIQSSQTENLLGFLTQNSGDWKLYVLEESIQSTSGCQSMDVFTEGLTAAIAPKIFDNANNLKEELTAWKEAFADNEKTIKQLRSEMATLGERISILRQENTELKHRYTELLEGLLSGKATAADIFISQALSISDVNERSLFVLENGFRNSIGTIKVCVNKLIHQPSKFDDACQEHLRNHMNKG